jgi:hypothetical protein
VEEASLLIISGSGAASESAASLAPSSDPFPGSTIVAADPAVAARLLGGEHDEALRTAIGDSPAVAWVTAGDARIHVLPLDASGQATAHDTELPLQHGTVTIPAGTPVQAIELEGPAAGTIRFTSKVAPRAFDPWIRYFYPTADITRPFDGFRFRLFPPQDGSLQLTASLDPSRPMDEGRNSALLAADAPLVSNFRAPAGAPLTLAPSAGAGFKFAFDPARKEGYQVLTGEWQLGGAAGETNLSVLLGLSGSEYVNIPATWVARFVPDAPAYAPSFQMTGVSPFPLTSGTGSGRPITTTWVYFTPVPAGPTGTGAGGYFSQPQVGPYFTTIPNAPSQSGILQLLPLVTAALPQGATGVFGPTLASFPMAPYAGLEVPAGGPAGFASSAELFETTVLNPARGAAIYAINRNAGPAGLGPIGPSGASGPTFPIEAVTPQGIFAEFSADGSQWQELLLATTAQDSLVFTGITGDLREALLSNQLFLVISNPEKLLANASTRFMINDQVLADARAAKVPDGAIKAAAQLGGIYPDLAAFQPAITNALGSQFAQYVPTFIELAELAQISISGWTFQLGPRHWSKDSGSGKLTQTLMIIKFSDSDFTTVAGDLSRWTLPASFNDDPSLIQQKLLTFLDDATKNVATQPDLQYFVGTVLATGAASWNGVLFLNAPVPPSEFPPQLRGLAAGLPQNTPFTAHHFGVAMAPFHVANRTITLGDSSLFGLILFDDPAYLVYQSNPYDFKVTSLHVLFKNSAIAAFSSQLQLLVAALFGETSALQNSTNGDNIVFDGLWQNNGTSESYSFTFNGTNRFVMTSKVLANVIITDAQFVTMPGGSPSDPKVATRFLLGGSIQFQELDAFDLFSFGDADPDSSDGLRFSNMFVSMAFDPGATPQRTFDFIAAQIIFNSGSVARPKSLYSRFPLSLAAVRQSGVSTTSGGTVISTPSDLGFIPVASPLPEGSLGDSFYGIEMTLNLGSPGALAPKLPFTASLLASWAPGEDALNAAVGLRLPGSDGGRKSLTIQGPLKLNIGDIAFLQSDSAYLLRFTNIALQFLSLKFPPNGKTSAMLFGDPNPAGGSRSLGWYAAYKKDSGGGDDSSATA